MKKRICFILLTALSVFFISCCSLSDSGIIAELKETEWSWESGGVISFSGEVLNQDNNIKGVSLKLFPSVSTDGDPGNAVFTSLNGKTIKIRNRKDSVTAEMTDGEKITVDGSWYLPDNISGIVSASIKLSVYSESGIEICSAVLEKKLFDDSNSAAIPQAVAYFYRIQPFLAATVFFVWALAIIRNIIIKKRPEDKKK